MKSLIERWSPKLIGGTLMAYALFGFVFIVIRPLRLTLRDVVLTLDALFIPIAHLSLAWCVALGLVGMGLWQKRRAAWAIAVGGLVLLNVGNLLFYIFSPETFETPTDMGALFEIGTVVQALLLVLMIAVHPAFTTRTRRVNVRAACLTWLIGSVVVCVMAVALVMKFPGSLVGPQRVGWALNHAALLSLVDRSFFDNHAPHAVAFIISIAAAIVLLLTLFVAVRSQQNQNSLSRTDETIVRSMIKRFNGNDSLAYFATRRDKSIIYSPNGRAAVTYRVEVGCAIASADPLGEQDSWDAAIDAFLEHAREYGWVPAVMGASEAGARAYERHGLSAMHLGDEAIVYTDRFDVDKPEFKVVRQAIAHAEREGVWMRVRRHHQISDEEMKQVEQRADSWRDTSDERGFSMALSRLGDAGDGDCVLVEALQGRGAEATVIAQLSFVPWGTDGLSLDLMRRGPQAPNGTVEAMVAYLCSNEDLLVRQVSLNFAVFRKVFASESQVGVDPFTKTTRKILVFLSRWWQMEALYRSNVKYNPEWVPRYMCFESTTALARTSFAAGIAEGFIPWIDSEDMRGHADIDSPGADAAVRAMARWEARSGKKTKKINKQVQARMTAVQALEAEGINPWAVLSAPTTTCAEVVAAPQEQEVTVAGRVRAKRKFGAIAFFDIADASGACQVIVDSKALRENLPQGAVLPNAIDLGDRVHIEGITGVSKKGQPSVIARAVRLEAKALDVVAPNANKKGNAQTPSAARMMAQGLLSDPEIQRELFMRSRRVNQLRQDLQGRGYIEMPSHPEMTTTLHLLAAVAGGADKVFSLEAEDSEHPVSASSVEQSVRPQWLATVMSTRADEQWARAMAGQLVPTGGGVAQGKDLKTIVFLDAINSLLAEEGLDKLEGGASAEIVRNVCQSLGLKSRPDATVNSMLATIFNERLLPQIAEPTEFTDVPAELQLGSLPSMGGSYARGWMRAENADVVASGFALDTKPAELEDTEDINELLQLGIPATGCVVVRI
ncbi:bifunctional lysylphosphatidylglycerol synthetase/lysine--tRNA ligase LysX [Corynebacterium urogenitale]